MLILHQLFKTFALRGNSVPEGLIVLRKCLSAQITRIRADNRHHTVYAFDQKRVVGTGVNEVLDVQFNQQIQIDWGV